MLRDFPPPKRARQSASSDLPSALRQSAEALRTSFAAADGSACRPPETRHPGRHLLQRPAASAGWLHPAAVSPPGAARSRELRLRAPPAPAAGVHSEVLPVHPASTAHAVAVRA